MEAQHKNIHAVVIERCLEGDPSAQESLYKLYSKAMYNICYRMCNSTEEAEDVLQESFVKAFKNLEGYRGTASIGSWLKRIVVNTAINHIRKKQLTLVPLDQVEADAGLPSDSDDNYLFLEVEKIKQGISQLPDGYRIVFSLYLLEGYDHTEIAEILGISVSTSKSQYNRAKSKLRSLLKVDNHGKGYA